MVMCAYYIAVNLPETFKGTLTIPLVSVSFLSVGGAEYKIMISKETIKEATTFRKTMFWFGIITLPIGLGLLFLLMWYNLKCAMDDYQRVLENER